MAIVSNSPLSPLSRFQHHLRNGVGRVDGVDSVSIEPRRRDAGVTEISRQVRDGDGSRRQSPKGMPKAMARQSLSLNACFRECCVNKVVQWLRQRNAVSVPSRRVGDC
ncbi:MAG: hypothetical protein ACO2PL_12320 [Armatimonadota bacterium]